MRLSLYGSKEIRRKISRNKATGFGNVSGGVGLQGNWEDIENQLWDGLSMGKGMGQQSGTSEKRKSRGRNGTGRDAHLCRIKKNYCWIWIAVDRFARRVVSFVCGGRGAETGVKLYDKLKDTDVGFYCTDHWKAYDDILSSELHLQTKAETYTVEGYNSRIRHCLARFKRKGKCYSKAKHMIEKSLNLLFMKMNNQLPILI